MLPLLKPTKLKRLTADSFLGLNKMPRIKPTEFAHMENLTSSRFPMLSSRDKRGELGKLNKPRDFSPSPPFCGWTRAGSISGAKRWRV